MIVGTVGAGVPEEVLAAAGAEAVPIVGEPSAPTDLADRYIEPLVGPRARSQLQRILDGTYAEVDVLVLSRESDASVRLFYSLRELRRLEPERGIPPLHLFDLQHAESAATARYNRRRVLELCGVVGAAAEDLPAAIRACNARRATVDAATGDSGRARVYLTGSEHSETRLRDAVAEAGGVLVGDDNDLGAVRTDVDGDAVDAIVRRCHHPALARAKASSAARAAWTAARARAVGADVVLAFYLEGDDGLRWELPEQREALAAAGIPVVALDRQPYEVGEVRLDA